MVNAPLGKLTSMRYTGMAALGRLSLAAILRFYRNSYH